MRMAPCSCTGRRIAARHASVRGGSARASSGPAAAQQRLLDWTAHGNDCISMCWGFRALARPAARPPPPRSRRGPSWLGSSGGNGVQDFAPHRFRGSVPAGAAGGGVGRQDRGHRHAIAKRLACLGSVASGKREAERPRCRTSPPSGRGRAYARSIPEPRGAKQATDAWSGLSLVPKPFRALSARTPPICSSRRPP